MWRWRQRWGGGYAITTSLQQGYNQTYWLASHILLSRRAKGARPTCRREYNTCTVRDCLAATVLLMIIRTPATTARVARQRHFPRPPGGARFRPTSISVLAMAGMRRATRLRSSRGWIFIRTHCVDIASHVAWVVCVARCVVCAARNHTRQAWSGVA